MNTERDTTQLLETWLAEPEPPLDEHVIDEAIDRLSSTPQRRRWWPFRWFPLGIGATRSAVPRGPRPERSTRFMLNATRVIAAAAILALATSFTFYVGWTAPEPAPAPASTTSQPAASDADAFRVAGTAGIALLENGTDTGATLRGRLGSNILMEMNDPRVSGEVRFLHHADDYGNVGVEWGTYRLENDEGAWQGPLSGFYHHSETRTSGWLTGEGAYEGLTYYMESVIDHGTGFATINGVVFPGSAPTDYPELAPNE